MRLVTYQLGRQTAIGAVTDAGVVDLTAVAPTLLDFIHLGADGLAQATVVVANSDRAIPLSDVTLLAPIPTPPRNVMCLGLNYKAHADESYTAKGIKAAAPDAPIVFTKATTAVSGPGAPIPYAADLSTEIDWEVELAIVIGKRGINIPADEAMAYVYGYMVLNDVSTRDYQLRGKQYFKGKSMDGHCPTGPWLVTADAIADPHDLALTCRVNGIVKQHGRTDHMIFNIPAIIEYLSRGMTLLPGDIIATGTPEGVGFARKPPEFLKPGDVLESEIDGIGVLRNVVTAV